MTAPVSPYEIWARAARFAISAARPNQFPPADRPEVAFAGRSNVGKSSLLNGLLGRKNLARVSSTPGRTQLINFFDLAGRMYFVDLPGFGYARVSREVRASWRPMVEGYLTGGRDLKLVVVLVDIRRDPGDEERNLLDWLRYQGLAAQVVATKVDQVGRSQRHRRLKAIGQELGTGDLPLVHSARTGEGRPALWARVAEACGWAEERQGPGSEPVHPEASTSHPAARSNDQEDETS